mmetsp:Transcript_32356/g.67600  ORF Transcript_32356/g.67600 Transcript_32356/m.67600 type:complete len:237 (-) Transcript_32356:203-913(-)
MPVGLAFLIHHLQNNRRVLVHCAQGKDRSVAIALVFVIVACPLRYPLEPRHEFLPTTTTTATPWDLSALEKNNKKQCNKDATIPELEAASADAGDESFCDPEGKDREESGEGAAKGQTRSSYLSSGLSQNVVARLLEGGGKELFLLWLHQRLGDDTTTTSTSRSSTSGSSSNNSETNTTKALQCLGNKERVRIALHLIRQDRDVAEPTRSTMQKINRFLMSSAIYRPAHNNKTAGS